MVALSTAIAEIPESKRVGGYANYCAAAGVITDALVAANATITLLNAAILAAVPAYQQPMARMLNKALNRGIALGNIAETHGQTTVAGLVALTNSSTTFSALFACIRTGAAISP